MGRFEARLRALPAIQNQFAEEDLEKIYQQIPAFRKGMHYSPNNFSNKFVGVVACLLPFSHYTCKDFKFPQCDTDRVSVDGRLQCVIAL